MSDFKFYIMIAIFDISIQLNIIKIVIKAYVIINNDININIRSIYIILKYLYHNLVSVY